MEDAQDVEGPRNPTRGGRQTQRPSHALPFVASRFPNTRTHILFAFVAPKKGSAPDHRFQGLLKRLQQVGHHVLAPKCDG